MLFQVLVSFTAIIYQSFVDLFMGHTIDLVVEVVTENMRPVNKTLSVYYPDIQVNTNFSNQINWLSRQSTSLAICVIYMSCMYHWVFCMRTPIWISMDQCDLKWVKLTVKCLAMCSPSRRTSPWWPEAQNEPWATQRLVVVDCGLSDRKWTSNMM